MRRRQMTKATKSAPTPSARVNAARKAGFEARKNGLSESAFTQYPSETEKKAFLLGWHESMVKFHQARARHYKSETDSEAKREDALFAKGQKFHEDGRTRAEAEESEYEPINWTIVTDGWDCASEKAKSDS